MKHKMKKKRMKNIEKKVRNIGYGENFQREIRNL